ncbi:hypothetical protein IW261DRAFT_1569619 [Armillaria novae-zelandiae]|uniref:Uncharacterized protein n=1 Tax=Armillaria novae-zelandiae TaxID=153914 RepID=A0AA39NXI0_9AGAR|nr:hypothetical protein IW261DRAFT_1569619 [Armillaria novae-zelandiae]
MESTVTHLSVLTDAKNGPSANTLMAKVIANLNGMIQTVPTVVLAAHYPEQLSDEPVIRWMDNYLAYNRVYEACKQHMCDMDIIVYADRVNALNRTLMRQAILFPSPQWFHRMTTSMCREYIRICDMHNSRKAVDEPKLPWQRQTKTQRVMINDGVDRR